MGRHLIDMFIGAAIGASVWQFRVLIGAIPPITSTTIRRSLRRDVVVAATFVLAGLHYLPAGRPMSLVLFVPAILLVVERLGPSRHPKPR